MPSWLTSSEPRETKSDAMAAFDRDAALERQQIQKISLNVARRLLKVLERSRFAPRVAAEIASSARVISEIQREIDQIVASWPGYEPLDFAVLTHVLGSHQHALGLLELLEQKTAGLGNAPTPQPDHARAHAALLATSRAIEQDAQHYARQGFAALRPPVAQLPPPNFPPPPGIERRPPPRQLPPVANRAPGQEGAPQPRGKPKPQPKAPPRAKLNMAWLRSMRDHLVNPKNAATTAGLTVVLTLVIGILSFMPSSDERTSHHTASLSPGQKLDGRLGPDDAPSAGASLPGSSAEAATILSPSAMSSAEPAAPVEQEQPYLVVLTTRQSTEELQQDLRSYKASYPDLLGTAKARVDRVQGQDRQTWYRMSLIPPQSQKDAKSLCSSLKAAGLTGCWIKPVPLH